MSAQHTPGPWSFDEGGDDHVKVGGTRLASPCAVHPEWKANARLIAAAPDLLEALSRAADEFDLILQRLRDGQPERAEGAAICGAKDARAAIAKMENADV